MSPHGADRPESIPEAEWRRIVSDADWFSHSHSRAGARDTLRASAIDYGTRRQEFVQSLELAVKATRERTP